MNAAFNRKRCLKIVKEQKVMEVVLVYSNLEHKSDWIKSILGGNMITVLCLIYLQIFDKTNYESIFVILILFHLSNCGDACVSLDLHFHLFYTFQIINLC